MIEEKPFFIAEEAAEFLRIKKSTLYAWVHQKKIPYRKHGRLLVFSRADLLEWSASTSQFTQETQAPNLSVITEKCYNSRSKAGSLKTEYSHQKVHQQSTLYDPFDEGESA